MYVHAIISSFQGVIDGVVFASTSHFLAKEELDRLVREEVVPAGEEWSEDDVWAEYGRAVEGGAKVTEFYLDEFEVQE